MILVDASVWIDHLRTPNLELARRLKADEVRLHPLVFGELVMGNLPRRGVTLRFFRSLRSGRFVDHRSVRALVEQHGLSGLGVGFIDAHLLASALASPGALVWTRDRRLLELTQRFGVAFDPLAAVKQIP